MVAENKNILSNRDKIMKKIGDSVGLIFNKEEQKLYNLFVGKDVSVTIKPSGGFKKC